MLRLEAVAEAEDSSVTQKKGERPLVGSSYQAMASEDCNTLRKPYVPYSDLWIVQNCENIALTCCYESQDCNKFNYQSKPRPQSLNHVTLLVFNIQLCWRNILDHRVCISNYQILNVIFECTPCLLRNRVKNLGPGSNIPTEFRGYCQSLNANATRVAGIWLNRFRSASFAIHYALMFVSFEVTQSELWQRR
jgi:hypothetical protein